MKNEMNLRRKLYAALRKLTISWYKFILTYAQMNVFVRNESNIFINQCS